jgi:hypothetical protein
MSPGPAGNRRGLSAHPWILGLALFALLALPAQLRPRHFPSDDTYFYLQVARHIAAGEGSAFNGVMPTNGYHPLWMIPCVAVAWLSGGDPDRALRLAFALAAALTLAVLVSFTALARALGIRSGWVSLPLLATYFLTGLYGSEAHLNAICLLLALHALLRFAREPAPGRALLLGGSLGLAFLARLDNGFLVAAALIAAAIRAGPGRRHLAAIAAAAALALSLPYLAWNVATFGHLVQISGAIKGTFPVVMGDLRNLGALGLASAVGALAALAWLARPRSEPDHRLVLGTLAIGTAANALYVVLYTDHHTHWSWYYVPGVLLGAFFGPAAFDSIFARGHRRVVATVLAASFALTALWGVARGWARYVNPEAASHNQFVIEWLPPAKADPWGIQFARWMDRRLAPGSRVLVFDYPGVLAYYSRLDIVAGDGLVGDFRYDEELRAKGLAAYLEAKGIRSYVAAMPDGPDTCRVEVIFAPLSRVAVGALELCPQDRIGAARDVVRGVPYPEVALYRIVRVLPPPPGRHLTLPKHGLW